MKLLAILGIAIAAAFAAPAFAQDDVKALFEHAYSDRCAFDPESSAAEFFPDESWTLTWQEEYSDTPSTATLYQFFCSAGAYNISIVYYLKDQFDSIAPISFSVPAFDVKYENDDFDSKVQGITVRGFKALSMLTNPEYDPDTQSITEHLFWRGIGDASSSGHWVFQEGSFVLKSYDVDASYDGDINPKRIIEYK